MRVLKFRAWDKEKKEMIYTGLDYQIRFLQLDEQIPGINKTMDELKEQTHLGFGHRDAVRFEVMQYVGVNDISGYELCEGDICSIEDSYIGDSRVKAHINYIVFDDGSFCFDYESNKRSPELDSCSVANWEIKKIGNVYENPQLLKV